MKRILFFFSSTVVGGAETNILKISRELTKEGYQVFWAVLADDGPLFEMIDFELGEKIEIGLFYKNPIKFWKLYKAFVKRNKIEVVFNFGLRAEIISRLISKNIGIKKVISNIRSTDDWRKWYHIFLDWITQFNVDQWVSNSEAGKKAFHKREKIPLSKIEVIYNFFEPGNSNENVPDATHQTGSLRIGILANITPEKGYFDLIPVSLKLNALGIAHKFIYAGKDKTHGKFHDEITQANLSVNFEYLGYINNKAAFFNEIDVFMLPSYLEGMPTVLLEAMSFSKPIIATNVGGIPELIEHKKHGWLLGPGDTNGFVTAIQSLSINEENHTLQYQSQLRKFEKQVIMKKWQDLLARI